MATWGCGYCGFIFHWTGWAVNWEWWVRLVPTRAFQPKADLRCAQQRPTLPERLISVSRNAQVVTVGLAWTNLIRHWMQRVAEWAGRCTLFDVLMKGIYLVSVHWRLIAKGTVDNEGCTVDGRQRCSYTCMHCAPSFYFIFSSTAYKV